MRITTLPVRPCVASVLALAFCAATVPALAAAPARDAVYTGTLHPHSIEPKTIKLHVSKSGRTATAKLFCHTPNAVGTIRHMRIGRGRFKGHQRTGSLLIWSLSGHFASRDKAVVRFHLNAACSGHGARLALTRVGPA